MEFFMNNWYLIVGGLCVVVVAGFLIWKFFGLPTATQLEKVREWLLLAVVSAEKELGSGTGALKLRQVYDLFLTRFPWLARVISFSLFSSLVDEALDTMRDLLAKNEAVKTLIEGKGKNG